MPTYPLTQLYSDLCQYNAWCTYQAVDHTSIIIQYIVLAILLIGVFIVGRYFYLLIKLRQNQQYAYLFAPTFIRVYAIVCIWLVCSVIKIVINIVAFHGYISKDYTTFPQPGKYSPIVVLSALFVAFDMSATFFVLGLIIFIPYQWFKFLLNHLNRAPQQIPLQSRKLYSKSFILLKIIRFYIIGRTIFLLFNFIESILIIHTKFGCELPGFSLCRIIFIVVESIVMLFLYWIVLYVAEHTKKMKLVRMDIRDYQRLRWEYILLMVALLARIFLNSFFNGLADHILSYKPQINCYDANPDNALKRTIFLILGYSIMHFLPIGLIVYIYSPNIQARKRQQTILNYNGYNIDSRPEDYNSNNNVNVTQVNENSRQHTYQRI